MLPTVAVVWSDAVVAYSTLEAPPFLIETHLWEVFIMSVCSGKRGPEMELARGGGGA